jgi:uncharacterized protein (TIGR00725 family)
VPCLAKATIGVMGSGSEEHNALATELGTLLARLEVNLLTGAGGGVMTSVSRAFCDANPAKGISIGIVPCAEDNRAAMKPGYPNKWVQLPIVTHLPYSGRQGTDDLSRNHINVLSCAAIVALPGDEGTESEARLAVQYKKPIVAFSPNPLLVARFPDTVRRVSTITEVEEFLRTLLGNAA